MFLASLKVGSQALAGTSPPGGSNKLVHKVQLYVNQLCNLATWRQSDAPGTNLKVGSHAFARAKPPASSSNKLVHKVQLYVKQLYVNQLCNLAALRQSDGPRTSLKVGSQALAGATPPGGSNQTIHKVQLDVNDPLVGNVPQLGVTVQNVHVLFHLGLGNQPHLLLAHTSVPQLHVSSV